MAVLALSTDAVRDALDRAALTGWRALSKPLEEARGVVVVLTSPDYDPTSRPPSGRLFSARGDDALEALDAAVAKAVRGRAH